MQNEYSNLMSSKNCLANLGVEFLKGVKMHYVENCLTGYIAFENFALIESGIYWVRNTIK